MVAGQRQIETALEFVLNVSVPKLLLVSRQNPAFFLEPKFGLGVWQCRLL